MKKLLLSIFLVISLAITSFAGEPFFTDVIVTSPNGLWTDARAYSTLNDAVTAVGANERTIVIAIPQVVTSLTIPSTVTLKFERNGSITNSGYLNIQTKNIIAENRQIFTGVGNIDFAAGSELKTGWFSNIETAFALTANDTITLIVSKPQTITASFSPGNNVYLKWKDPGNILTVGAGVIVGNLKNIEAGNFQLFAGLGDLDFLDGSRLKLAWFENLRSVLTWVETEKVTIVISGTNVVGLSDSATDNEYFDFISEQGIFSISFGITLTLHSPAHIIASLTQQIFTGAGRKLFSAAQGDISIMWTGAVVDGADCTAAIQEAEDSVASTKGANIVFPAGKFQIDGTVNKSPYTSWRGVIGHAVNTADTKYGTVLYSTSNAVAINIVTDGGTIDAQGGIFDMSILGPGFASTSATAISIGAGVRKQFFDNLYITQFGANGIVALTGEIYINRGFISNCLTSINFNGTSDSWIHQTHAGSGLTWGGASGTGILLTNTNNITISNSRAQVSKSASGISIAGSNRVSISNSIIDQNDLQGISIRNSKNIILSNNMIFDNGTAGVFTDNGISIIALDGENTSNITITGGRSYDRETESTGTGKTAGSVVQNRGISFGKAGSGTINNVVVQGLNLVNAPTPVNSESSVTGLRIRDCQGYVNANTGTGTILNGATTSTITHGLSVTPRVQDIFIIGTSNPNNDVGTIWVNNLGAATFIVNVDNDPGAANWNFAWHVVSPD